MKKITASASALFMLLLLPSVASAKGNDHAHGHSIHVGLGKTKVAICHTSETGDKHTLSLPTPAIAAHLGHGDTEGACGDTTNEDTTAPVISDAIVSAITSTGAKITLTTDEQSTAKAFFSLTTPVNKETAANVSSTTLGTSHEMLLTGLQAATTYHVLITATDAAGNVATLDEKTFMTLPVADTTAPTLTASSIDAITTTGATVNLTADENVAASVFYGLTSPIDVATAAHFDVALMDDTQSLALTGLTPGTKYYAVIVVTDASGNKTTGVEKTFTTLSLDTTAPTAFASSIDAITATGATVHVTADENVTATVYFSTATPVNTGTADHVSEVTLDDAHDIALTGLTSSTTYHAVIVITDSSGNSTILAEKTFMTLAP